MFITYCTAFWVTALGMKANMDIEVLDSTVKQSPSTTFRSLDIRIQVVRRQDQSDRCNEQPHQTKSNKTSHCKEKPGIKATRKTNHTRVFATRKVQKMRLSALLIFSGCYIITQQDKLHLYFQNGTNWRDHQGLLQTTNVNPQDTVR